MPGNPLTDPNWAADVADTIERVVGNVRDKTTKPIVKIARGVVFGLLAGILAIVAVVILVIASVRAVQALLDLPFRRSASVYLSYLIVGGLFSLVGLFLLSKRYSND
jgi:hypothetical protein